MGIKTSVPLKSPKSGNLGLLLLSGRPSKLSLAFLSSSVFLSTCHKYQGIPGLSPSARDCWFLEFLPVLSGRLSPTESGGDGLPFLSTDSSSGMPSRIPMVVKESSLD